MSNQFHTGRVLKVGGEGVEGLSERTDISGNKGRASQGRGSGAGAVLPQDGVYFSILKKIQFSFVSVISTDNCSYCYFVVNWCDSFPRFALSLGGSLNNN